MTTLPALCALWVSLASGAETAPDGSSLWIQALFQQEGAPSPDERFTPAAFGGLSQTELAYLQKRGVWDGPGDMRQAAEMLQAFVEEEVSALAGREREGAATREDCSAARYLLAFRRPFLQNESIGALARVARCGGQAGQGAPAPSGGAAGGFAFQASQGAGGTTADGGGGSSSVGSGIIAQGSESFKKKVQQAVSEIEGTQTGSQLLQKIAASGLGIVVRETKDSNAMTSDSGKEIQWNPSYQPNGVPAMLVLAHELIHAEGICTGKGQQGEAEEARVIGLGKHSGDDVTENSMRKELGLPRRNSDEA